MINEKKAIELANLALRENDYRIRLKTLDVSYRERSLSIGEERGGLYVTN